MFRKKKKKRPEISAPKNFEHRVHTSFDAKRGCYVGLPTQWQSLIENLRRPLPLVDPSTVTQVELVPRKVSPPWGSGVTRPDHLVTCLPALSCCCVSFPVYLP